jgi:chemotaxis protein methyltransferase CheR
LARRARQYADAGQIDEALAWCTRALANDQLDARSHYLYATIQQARGDDTAAIQALQRTIYLDPDFVMAHLALAHLARRQAKPRVAEKHFANLIARLQTYPPEAILPDSDGLTAGRLAEIVRATLASDNAARNISPRIGRTRSAL